MKSKCNKSVSVAALTLLLGLSAPASADTFSMTAGPIPLSPVPLNVCNGNTCVKTPPLGNAKLTVSVTPHDLLGVVPSIRLGSCPVGQIGTAIVVTVARDASVSALVTGNVGNLLFNRPVQEFVIGANRTTVLSLCTF
jgi:hypothetical protein